MRFNVSSGGSMNSNENSGVSQQAGLAKNNKEQYVRIAPNLLERLVAHCKKSGLFRIFILVSSALGHIITWITLGQLLFSNEIKSIDKENIFYLVSNILWIFATIFGLYIGSSRDKVFRNFIENALSYLLNLMFILSFAISIALVLKFGDITVINARGDFSVAMGPASIFAAILFMSMFVAVNYFNHKASSKNHMFKFAPIFMLFAYAFIKWDEIGPVLFDKVFNINWQNLGPLVLVLTMVILVVPYAWAILRKNATLED